MPNVIMPPPEQAPVIAGVTDAFALFRVFADRPEEFRKFMDFWGDWLKRYEKVVAAYTGGQAIEKLQSEAEADRAAAEQDRQDAASALRDAMKDSESMKAQAKSELAQAKSSIAERQKALELAAEQIDKDREKFETEQKIRLEAIAAAQLNVDQQRNAVAGREAVVQEHLDRLKAAGFNVVA